MSEHEILVQPMVQNFARRQRGNLLYILTNTIAMSTLLAIHVQRRLSIYNWNPGPRRRKEDASRTKLQEGGISSPCKRSDYVDHELLTKRFHVTHHAGCAVLFNKDTFYPPS